MLPASSERSPRHDNVCHSVAAYLVRSCIPLSQENRSVQSSGMYSPVFFSGVLHAPLTIRQLSVCSAHTYLFQSLLFLSAIIFYTLIIIKVAFGNVNVKFALPTISACRRLYGGFSCPERLFRSVHALSVFHKEPFLKFPSFSQPAVYFHALSVILPE